MASPGAEGPTHLIVKANDRRDLAPMVPEGSYGTYGASSSQGRELSLSLLWRVAYEWRWLVLAAVGVGIAAAVLITLLTPLKYRSVASLELNPPNVEILNNQESKGRQSSGNDMNFVGTQLGLMQSRALAERVAQDLNLASVDEITGGGGDRAANTEAAAGYVQANNKATLQPQSMIVKVAFVSRDPQLAAKIVNGVTDAFIATDLERRYQSSSYARNFLQQQIANTRRDLEKSERELTAYAQQQRLITTGGGANDSGSDTNSLSGNSLVALNNALAQTQARRIAAEQQYRQAMQGGATTETSANTAALRSQIAGLEAEYQQKLQTFRSDYPEMVALRARITALRDSVKSEARTANSDPGRFAAPDLRGGACRGA